ncbi:MAG: hypothetical protein AB1798_18325, partial [Spirochaetota bacterium]
MKKLTFISGAVIILLFFFVACQKKEAKTETPAAKPETEVEKKAAVPTIKFLTIQPHNVASSNLATWFEQEAGVKVELLVVP